MSLDTEIITRATNPEQYDSSDIAWSPDMDLRSPTRAFIWEYLQPFSKDWHGKTFLDIGAGSGWLVEEARKAGARAPLGIEPSKQNAEIAYTLFPNIAVERATVDSFHPQQSYDIITSILMVSHVRDLNAYFDKIADLLAPSGEFFLVTMEYDFYQTPRFGYTLKQEKIDEGTYAIMVTTEDGKVLADIVRKASAYTETAQAHNLTCLEHRDMTPTQAFLEAAPKFEAFAEKPIFTLFRFRK